jgi:hypothetical protein
MTRTAADTAAARHDAHFDLMDDATAEAAVAYDDGDLDAVRAFVATATATQRRHLTAEMADTDRKRAAAAPRPARTGTDRAARNAAAYYKALNGAADYEGRCLR